MKFSMDQVVYSKAYYEGRDVAFRYMNDLYEITCPYSSNNNPIEFDEWLKGFKEGMNITMAAAE